MRTSRGSHLDMLGAENLDKVTLHVAHRACRQVLAAFQTADLMTTWSNDTVNGVVIANDALERTTRKRLD